MKGGELAMDIAVVDVLWIGDESTAAVDGAVLKLRLLDLKHEAACIAVGTRAGQRAGAGIPARRAVVRNEVVDVPFDSPARDIDLNPPGLVRGRANAESSPGCILEHPISDVVTGRVRRGQGQAEIHGLARGHAVWQIDRRGTAQLIARGE